jgi:hypothetical protein
MLTPEDIKNLTEFQKTIFATKAEMEAGFDNINKKLDNLQTSVDAISFVN